LPRATGEPVIYAVYAIERLALWGDFVGFIACQAVGLQKLIANTASIGLQEYASYAIKLA
jgi:hypothetical protein